MEFLVNMIEVTSAPTVKSLDSLGGNCTHVSRRVWLMEGDVETLRDDGIEFNLLQSDLVVESLGDHNRHDLKKYIKSICVDSVRHWIDD